MDGREGSGLPLRRDPLPIVGGQRVGLVATIVATTFIVTLSTTSLAVAVPALARDLHSSALGSAFVIVTPLLVGTALLIPFGRLSDLVGRRASYLAALSVFAVSSALIGAAASIWVVVALQVLQAAGVAAVWANSAAILFESLSTPDFRHALGYYIAAISVADLVGPTAGGAITQGLGWPWVFGITALAGAGCLGLAARVLPRRSQPRGRVELDMAGVLLLVTGLTSIVGGLLALQSVGSPGVAVPAGCAAGITLLAVFAGVEWRRRSPLVDLRLFADRRFSLSVGSAALNAAATWVPSLLLVLYFQAHDGDTPLAAGLLVLPLPLASGLSSLAMGRLSAVTAPDRLALAGSAVAFAGLAGLGWALSAPYQVLFLVLALIGCGAGVFSPAVADVMLHQARAEAAGIANGTRLTAQNLGWASGTALALAMATSRLPAAQRRGYFTGQVHSISVSGAHLLLTGYQLTFGVLAAVAAAATLLAYAVVRVRQPGGHPS